MNDVPIRTFQHFILQSHHAEAHLVDRVFVRERFHGEPAWDGEVLVFALNDHAAPLCYAWELDGELTAVLHEPPVDSPAAAVRAAIMAEYETPEA
jgi:hypothetical protein